MQPTPEQSIAIHISDKNLIVVAGAGSGKTRVLVERFLQLLGDNPDWRINALVAVTFTREAAFEMRHRLRQELERRTRENNASHWARHLAQLDSARIDTIHGLCADLLRANAAHAGVDPMFAVLDENDSAILLDDVVHDVLATIEAPLSTLFAHYDAFKIDEALRQPSLVNAEYAPVPEDADALFRQWEREWSDAVFDARRKLLGSADMAALAEASGAPEEDKLAELVGQYGRYREQIKDSRNANAIARLLKECYDKGAVRNIGSAKAWGGAEAKKEAAETLRQLRRKIDETLKEIGDPPNEIDRATAAMLPLWHQLLQKVRTTYRGRKRENAQLDFDDLERLAAQLLQQDAVRKRYRGTEFKHLLVDEFQDTNAAQWQIINSLADLQRGGSLFVVGDPKQSIYQFRGADVSVFNQVRNQIAGHAAGYALPLSTSFRSHRPLVEQFNALFAKILLRDESSPVKDYEVKFGKPMTAFRQNAPALPAISLQLLEAEERDESGEPLKDQRGRRITRRADDMRRWEAFEIAAQIKRMIAEERPVFSKATGQTRAMAYRDAAVLFQSMTNLTLYEEVFKAQDIPFLTVAGRGYFDQQEVWDMLDLLRFLHNPADSLSLASILRSPIFAFSDDLLFALRLLKDDASESREPKPLWQALQIANEHPMTGVAENDLPVIKHALEVLDALLSLAGRMTISELLRRALALTNYLAILTGLPDGDRRRGNVEKLLQLAEDSGKITLGKFTQYLADLTAREVREGEAALEPGDAIRLMTVHASKGLEFPLVVLADASWERGGRGDPTIQVDPDFGLSCSIYSADSNKYESGFAHRRNRRLQALKEAAERKRLLYVAATRAQDYLLISGVVTQNRDGRWGSRGWLKLLLPALDLTDIPREPQQLRDFAGCHLQIRMPPEPPAPQQFRHSAHGAATLWDADASADDYPPLMPPLMRPLVIDSGQTPPHISATQIAHLGAWRHGSNAAERHQSARRYQDIALTGMSEDDYDRAFAPRHNWERLIGRILHEVLRFAEFSLAIAPSEDLIRSIAWEQGLTNAAAERAARQEISRLLREFSGSEAHQWITSARAAQRPLYTELPFMFRKKAFVVHGVIDVLLQRGDGEWVIIDYKTDQVAEGDFTKHAKRYRMQLALYADAAREQLRLARPPLAYVHYIRGNQMIALASEDTQRELDEFEKTIGELAAANGQT
ncbi:MAG: UvrD-helicase domain-containing protein [Chloroflexota bacterium]|nr:UvrD-helicase domain-containing protein [Chloroflexota bacterium]MDE2910741.1 UvrD-helicase domain-containing protein [Chloroflexota bacterium]